MGCFWDGTKTSRSNLLLISVQLHGFNSDKPLALFRQGVQNLESVGTIGVIWKGLDEDLDIRMRSVPTKAIKKLRFHFLHNLHHVFGFKIFQGKTFVPKLWTWQKGFCLADLKFPVLFVFSLDVFDWWRLGQNPPLYQRSTSKSLCIKQKLAYLPAYCVDAFL